MAKKMSIFHDMLFFFFSPVISEVNLKQVFRAVIRLLIYMSMVKDKEALIWGGKGDGYGRGRIEHM